MTSYPQPTLTNGRLTLRPPQAGDVPALVEACQDPEISRWTRVPSPYTADHARLLGERRARRRRAPARMEPSTGPVYVVFAWSAT